MSASSNLSEFLLWHPSDGSKRNKPFKCTKFAYTPAIQDINGKHFARMKSEFHYWLPSIGGKFVKSHVRSSNAHANLEDHPRTCKWLGSPPFNKNYFTSSDPHHDMSGGGSQVGVVRVSTPCYWPPHSSFLLFRTSHLLPPTHQENTWQTYTRKNIIQACQ